MANVVETLAPARVVRESETGLAGMIATLRAIVGDEHVVVTRSALAEYEATTFATGQGVSAVVLPASTAEVQRIVEAANRFRTPLYPLSRGRNWGLGSRVPVADGSVIVDLQRMNRIIEFDEELSYVTVEPGVTFRQLSDFLKERGSRLYAAAIGGPPDASLVGNALERGDGLGPLGERSEHCGALEAVTGTGALIHTGLQAFTEGVTGKLWPAGLGPNLQGLLFQGNLAIVTRMTIWLARKPAEFQGVVFAIPDEAALARVTDAMRSLVQDGVIKPNSYALWNAYKLLASLTQYPWRAGGVPQATLEALLEGLPSGLRGAPWIGISALYSASKAHARAERTLLKKALGRDVSRLIILNRRSVGFMRRLRPLIARFGGLDPELLIRTFYSESPFIGSPTEFSTASTYWRKRAPRPAQMNPDRDRCGLHWVCTAVPFDGRHIAAHAKIITSAAKAHGLEPNISYLDSSQRLLKCFAVISFDRDVSEEELGARACHDEMLARLAENGYPPVRLGIQSMASIAPRESSYDQTLRKLKALFDPNDVLAPGRYDFRHSWPPPWRDA